MSGTFKPVSVGWGRERKRAIWMPGVEECFLDHVDRDTGVSRRQVGEESKFLHMTI
jgi:hypothetical protein